MVSAMLYYIEGRCDYDERFERHVDYPLKEIVAITKELRRVAGNWR